jgi:hypothetical protein
MSVPLAKSPHLGRLLLNISSHKPNFVFRALPFSARRISSARFNRHKKWDVNFNQNVAEFYPDYVPPRPADFEFPTINFWDQDEAGNRQHVATVRNEQELKDLGKQEKEHQDMLEEMEMEYDGPSSNFPPDARVRLITRIREVENDPDHQEALKRLMIMKPEDKKMLEEMKPENSRLQTDPELEEIGITKADIADAIDQNADEDARVVDPKIRALNTALCMAYVGANDDIRAELWMAYSRAKTVPDLLHWIPDDAWDMIYWSQAAKWGSNTNRDAHVAIIEKDLRSVGRDGPPTKDL